MAEEEKKEPESETKEEGAKEEKKEGWWARQKKKIADNNLESSIRKAYEQAHHRFDVYPYDGGLFDTIDVYGDIEDGALTYFGEKDVKPFSVVIDKKDNKAYYAGNSEKATVRVLYESTEYERPGTKVELDPNVEEIPVIKAEKRYFIYKGPLEEKK